MEVHKKVRVYNDGSHHIGIPYIPQPWKRKKKIATKQKQIIPENENVDADETLPVERENEVSKESLESIATNKVIATTDGLKMLFDRLYDEVRDKKRKEKYEIILKEFEKYLDKEKAKEFVDKNFERKQRNLIERRKRFVRKVRQQKWDYFVTLTYDDKKHNEESFRKTLSNTLKHLSSRKGWKYVGVWERGKDSNRLHFHALMIIPNMVGEFEERRDYSTEHHKMQTANQNTFFLERFGRNDFSKIENDFILNDSIRYLMKYLEKSGEKIIYSKGLYTYFVTDIMEDDVACRIGIEDKKLLLFDNFTCFDSETGEIYGKISQETKDKLEKSN